jgi:hypothetical protein
MLLSLKIKKVAIQNSFMQPLFPLSWSLIAKAKPNSRPLSTPKKQQLNSLWNKVQIQILTSSRTFK